MADQQTNNTTSSDEIDLGQLFQLIRRGFDAIFRFILRVFLYLKKNILILIGLLVVGLAIGYGLNKITTQRLKTEIIVQPQLDSKNYLYDAVNEIQSNISAKDTLFFKSIGIDSIDFSGLEITIGRVVEEGNSENDLQFLELLQSFENTDAIADIVRAELQNKSSFNHRITVFYKDVIFGDEFAKKVIAYINSNQYFNGLIEVRNANATNRINENEVLLKQVDEIIVNYTNGLANKTSSSASDRIVLENQEQVNIADIFKYKTQLIQDIESKKLELEQQTEVASVINFGKPQAVQKSFFGKNIILIPVLLLVIFFIISFFRFLNARSKILQ
jgi:hypothetical protein